MKKAKERGITKCFGLNRHYKSIKPWGQSNVLESGILLAPRTLEAFPLDRVSNPHVGLQTLSPLFSNLIRVFHRNSKDPRGFPAPTRRNRKILRELGEPSPCPGGRNEGCRVLSEEPRIRGICPSPQSNSSQMKAPDPRGDPDPDMIRKDICFFCNLFLLLLLPQRNQTCPTSSLLADCPVILWRMLSSRSPQSSPLA